MPKLDNRIIGIITLLIILAGLVIFTRVVKAPGSQTASVFESPKPRLTTIFFGGDIMLSRNVARKIYEANDFSLPFQNTKEEIASADISFANLESPFNDVGNHFVEGSLVFNADPKSVAGLKTAGFDILSTANNHAFDQGLKGLDFTIQTLINNAIIPTGTTPTQGEASLPVIKKNDILFGFLSYSYTAKNDGGKSTSPYINNFNDLDKLKQDILGLKGHNADVVIVNMHAGTEYTRTPTDQQVAFAHAAIDAGADLVIGEHPHWIQTIEEYKGKWIFYSLGNFVFDQMFSQDTREGLTLKISFENQEIKKIELKPVVIENYCCPRFANSDETAAILGNIGLTSAIILGQN